MDMHRFGIVTAGERPRTSFVARRYRVLVIAGIVSLLLLVSMLVNAAMVG